VATGKLVPAASRPGWKQQKIPYLVHNIWLGGPLHNDGVRDVDGTVRPEPRQAFKDNVTRAIDDNPDFRFLLWTDVSRATVDRVRNLSQAELTDPYDIQVKDMLDWAARSDRLHLVNVDEVFTQENPLALDAEYRGEGSRGTGFGYAGASDVLRLGILDRFGGVYADGDNKLRGDLKYWVASIAGDRSATSALVADAHRNALLKQREIDQHGAESTSETNALRRELQILRAAPALVQRAAGQGFALSTERIGMLNNSALISAAGHPAVRIHQALLRENFTYDLVNVMVKGDSRIPDVVFAAMTAEHRDNLFAMEDPRTEVIRRSGPAPRTFQRLAAELGLNPGPRRHPADLLPTIPHSVIEIGTAHSWDGRSSSGTHIAGSGLPPIALNPEHVAELAVVNLLRETANRPGRLYLPAAARVIDKLPWPGDRIAAWYAALDFIAGRPDVVSTLSVVVIGRQDLPAVVLARIRAKFPGLRTDTPPDPAPNRSSEFRGRLDPDNPRAFKEPNLMPVLTVDHHSPS
jgi:hypothetical protein